MGRRSPPQPKDIARRIPWSEDVTQDRGRLTVNGVTSYANGPLPALLARIRRLLRSM